MCESSAKYKTVTLTDNHKLVGCARNIFAGSKKTKKNGEIALHPIKFLPVLSKRNS